MNKNILAHAAACAPAESCGYVVKTSAGERYFPCQNLSAEPTMYFRMDPADYLQAQVAGDVVAPSTAIPMACRISAMLIAACRCRVACRGGWSAMTGYTNFAACRSSPGGHLSMA